LRIEDTDQKRTVVGAERDFINVLAYYGIKFDEGVTVDGEKGDYGPYRQTCRTDIYCVYAKKLVSEGLAYPCFCTAEELDAVRKEQEEKKVTPGYHGEWAVHRDMSPDDAARLISEGRPYVLRLRSDGSADKKVKFTDLVRGNIEMPENDEDFVLLKSDGIPTYHFAHAVDDHLMRTTIVVRGEEWLPSVSKHLQLFRYLGFKAPKYLHSAQLMKMEGSSKKKLSKRDKGAAVSDYMADGYAPECVREYVMTLLNSNFEEWRRANPDADLNSFPFSVKKMSASGCLFDFDKLNDVSRNTISRMTADHVYASVLEWAREYDAELAKLLERDRKYAVSIFSIGRGGKKPRKDITTWSDVKSYIGFFYDELFAVTEEYPDTYDKADISRSLSEFLSTYNESDVQDEWFDKIKRAAASIGYADDMKAYKENPSAYRGNVSDVSMFIRVAVTGSTVSPDMYTVMQILGAERVRCRVEAMIKKLG
jgi:glutamyl-tRNA synthetase